MMNYPEDVMRLLRECSNVSHNAADTTTTTTTTTTQPFPMNIEIVMDHAKSHYNSVTELIHITSSTPPPLRPYLKTIGSAKRKRIVHPKTIDRWTASTTTTTATTASTTTAEGLLLHHHHHHLHHQSSRNDICVTPVKLPMNGSRSCRSSSDDNTTNKDRCDKYHFSPTVLLSSPTTTTTDHAIRLCSMFYGGGGGSSSSTNPDCRSTMSFTPPLKIPKPNVLVTTTTTESPPSDASPRLVRRLPSYDEGIPDDDLHRSMTVSDKQSLDDDDDDDDDHDMFSSSFLSPSSNGLLKRYTALPRQPERQTSQRSVDDNNNDQTHHQNPIRDHPDDDDNYSDNNNNPMKSIKYVVPLGNKKMTTTTTIPLEPKKVGVDMSPRKPERRLISDAFRSSVPLSPPSTKHMDDPLQPPPSLLSSSHLHDSSPPPPHHHHTTLLRSPTIRRGHHHHHHHHHNRNKSNNNHRTVKYLVEALTIVNLCDIENDRSSIHENINHSSSNAVVMDDDVPKRYEREPSTRTMTSCNSFYSSSDESTVESIPSTDEVSSMRFPQAA
jgi:hypothetical protein